MCRRTNIRNGLVKTFGIKYDKLSRVIYSYPTYSEVFEKMGKASFVDKIEAYPIVVNKLEQISKMISMSNHVFVLQNCTILR
jgi:hypothetical protein